MIIETSLELVIESCFQSYYANQDLTLLINALNDLSLKGYNIAFKEVLTEESDLWRVKKISWPKTWNNQSNRRVKQIIFEEKNAALELQDYLYAKQMIDLENNLDEEMLTSKTSTILLRILKPTLDYCVIIEDYTIYIYLKSGIRRFASKIKSYVNRISENVYFTERVNAISEAFFKIDENVFLANLVRNEYGKHWDSDMESHYAYIVFYESTEPIVFFAITDTDLDSLKQSIEISFKDHLRNIGRVDIKLLNVFQAHFPFLKQPVDYYNGPHNPFLDAILSETCGWIAHNHQLENIFMLATKLDYKEAEQFRKNYNKKQMCKVEPFFDTPLFDSTLGEIMKSRMVSEFVMVPYYTLLSILYAYLTESGE